MHPNEITEDILTAVEERVGTGRQAWDMVKPAKLIAAVAGVLGNRLNPPDAGEADKLRAAMHAAHDHLHAGRTDEAHEALHCGINAGDVDTGNITGTAASRLSRLIETFNHACKALELCACLVAFIPSATRKGFVSMQIGGEISACQMLEERLGAPKSNYTKG